MALFWHNHFATAYSKISGEFDGTAGDADARGEAGRGSRRHEGAARADPRVRARQLPRHARRDVEGSGDARLARRPEQHRGPRRRRTTRARSWSSSPSASTTYNEDDVKAAARVFTGWNLQTLGPTDARYYRYQFRADRARHQSEGLHLPDLSEAAGRRSPPTASRKASTSSQPSRRIPRPARASCASCTRTSSARRRRRRRTSSIASPGSTTRRATTCAPWCAPS